jgi:hypothetical protein
VNSPARVNFTLRLIVLILAITSVIIIIANSIYAIPSLVAYSSIGRFGEVGYYASQPMPGVPPGLLVRVFLINGSVVEPVRAFIDVYANAPNGIVHVSMGYSQSLAISFNNTNWRYVIDKWASLNVPFSEYNTSMLVFVTYVKGNESWILPLLVPYNVAWAIGGTTQPTSPRYILVNAFINVNELRPNKVVPVRLNGTVTDPQVFGTYNGYTVYNCSLSGPQPPTYPSGSTVYQPTSDCIGINGSLPIAWATWDRGVIRSDKGLKFELNIYFSGTIKWDAMATGYGDIGTSYSAPENWGLTLENAVQLGSLTQPGSVYWYYGGATWAIINYEVVYVTYRAVIQVGTTTVSEVLYVPPNDNNVNPAFDYGNGTISMLYNGAITLSQQYFGYPALNASTVVDYAIFSNGGLLQCNGPVYTYTGASGTYYGILLGGVNTAYSLSAAQIGTTLGGLAFDILVDAAAEAMTEGEAMPPIEFLNQVGSAIFTIAGLLIPPQTSSSVTQTTLEIGGVTTGTNLYISVINATTVYGLPTFGFILNATNYYGNPLSPTCKYGKVARIG